MFSWICPDCGRVVPPSQTECPDCVAKAAGAAQAAASPAAAAPRPGAAAPAASSPPQAAPAPYVAQPAAHSGLPAWLLTILFAFAFVGIIALVYYGYDKYKGRKAAEPASAVAFEKVPAAMQAKVHPLAKFLEVTGVRLLQDEKKQTEVLYVVVNHSAAALPELKCRLAILGAGDLTFQLPSLGPYESKELKSTLNTKLRVYELPDWQFTKTELQIISPPAS